MILIEIEEKIYSYYTNIKIVNSLINSLILIDFISVK